MEHDFWLQCWREGRTGFHQARVEPLLQKHWPALALPTGSRVFVPLAGKSRDLPWLAQQGQRVLGIELSPLAVQQFFAEQELTPQVHTSRYGRHHVAGAIELICGDVFGLDEAALHACVAVYDRAALVALPPELRKRYAAEVYGRLPPGCQGLLLTLEYPQAEMAGPPFAVPQAEVRALFGHRWELDLLEQRDLLAQEPKFAERGLSAMGSCVWRLRRRGAGRRRHEAPTEHNDRMNQDLKKTLWAAADKLRSSMDAAEYKHIVLGLIFLKYISDAFVERRTQLLAAFKDEAGELCLPDAADHAQALEERDYYTMANVFWVPASARWEAIRAQAKQSHIGVRIDAALEAIEADNPLLKGILDKRFGRTQLEPGRLGELVDLVSTIGFAGDGQAGHRAKDLLGEVYEYFLGQFASAEGKKGGQFYTPASVVKVLVEVLAPQTGRVYDPCCGSGGMFVQSEKFIEAHGGRADDISIYGQEANPTTWRLVAMNLAIRGFAADLGKEPADTFHRDQHPDLRADYVLANPPFNISDWGGERLLEDRRWAYGTPPAGNANYAWLQHILHHLSLRGQAGVVLANGSMSSNQSGEGDIRRAMVEADVVDVMVALPPQLFFNTQIPACLWFLARDKSGSLSRPRERAGVEGSPRRASRDRRGEVLFIDARKLGRMATRVNRVFDDEDVARIASTVHSWRDDGECDGENGADQPYADVPGFCRAVKLAEIAEHGHVLTPGRYVGAEQAEDDDEAFDEKMERLTAQLAEQMAKGAELDAVIREKLGGMGYSV